MKHLQRGAGPRRLRNASVTAGDVIIGTCGVIILVTVAVAAAGCTGVVSRADDDSSREADGNVSIPDCDPHQGDEAAPADAACDGDDRGGDGDGGGGDEGDGGTNGGDGGGLPPTDFDWGDVSPVTGAVRVPFVVTERTGAPRDAEPVTFGLPIPLGLSITSTENLGIVDEEGVPVPAQFRATGRWNGPLTDTTRPIRWVLVDFQASVAANSSRAYSLTLNRATTADAGIEVSETASRFIVDTGAAVFWISKTAASLFERVEVGGTIVVAEGASPGVTLSDGSVSHNAQLVSAVVEERGPMKVVLKLTGHHGSHSDFTCRIHFYRAKSYAKVFYRVENNRQSRISGEGQPLDVHRLGSQGSVNIEDLSLAVRLQASGALQYFAEGDAAPRTGSLTDTLSLYQESNGFDSWSSHVASGGSRLSAHVTFRGYRMALGASSIETGDHALGWSAVADTQKGIMGGGRDFWQQYPKALRARTNGTLELALFPREFPAPFNFRVGEYKTHESYFYFYTGNRSAEQLATLARALNEPLMGIADVKYYIATKAVQDFSERADALSGADQQDRNFERVVRTIYDGAIGANASWVQSYLSANAASALSSTGMYGYQDFGDLPVDFECSRGQYGLKYHAGYGFLIQFLRSGSFAFWELGENGERHEGDLDVVHTGRSGLQFYWDGAYYGHSAHGECGDDNPHRNGSGGNPDIMYGVPGLLLYYYMTGYEWAREYAVEIADTALWKAQGGCCLNRNNARAVDNTVRTLFEAYRATGNSKYAAPLLELITSTLANDAFYRPTAPYGEPLVSFATYGFLTDVGFYIDYRELVEGGALTSLRQSLLSRISTCRDNHYDCTGAQYACGYDDGVDYAVNFQDSDWGARVADVLALSYRYTGRQSDLSLAGRILNSSMLSDGIDVGCDPDVWGPNMLWRRGGPGVQRCSMTHYMQSKETVNIVLNGSVYMAVKHPVDPSTVIIRDP